MRHRALVDDALAERDLPQRIRIDQQPVAGEQKQRIDAEADPQREVAAPRGRDIDGMGGGHRHGGTLGRGNGFGGRSNHGKA